MGNYIEIVTSVNWHRKTAWVGRGCLSDREVMLEEACVHMRGIYEGYCYIFRHPRKKVSTYVRVCVGVSSCVCVRAVCTFRTSPKKKIYLCVCACVCLAVPAVTVQWLQCDEN